MSHKQRVHKKKFECGHKGLGKYCHRCEDVKAGRIVGGKMKKAEDGSQVAVVEKPKEYWNRAKCPFCGGSRVKKNDINAFSDLKAFEYTCTSFECGKSFDSDQVKEYEQVEARPRQVGPINRRLTD